MATYLASGLGGFAVASAQATYAGTPSFVSARTLTFKTAKATYNPHPVQGGPYLRNGAFIDIGSARELIWLDAMMTFTGDLTSVGAALLLASALGTSSTLTQLGTTTAYGLGGAAGCNLGLPEINSTFVDMQLGIPIIPTGTQNPETYHSGVITKAEWVFERTGLVTFSYDIDFQYLEKITGLATPSEPGGPVPFNMANASSVFKAGTYGSETVIDGVRKATITLERKMSTERIYLGSTYKEVPITNDNAQIAVALDVDYTTAAKTGLFDIFLAGTPTSVICGAVGAAIGSSGYNNQFQLTVTNAFVDTGGESPLDGPDLVKNTINLRGTLDTAGDPAMKAILLTADTAY